MNNYKKYLPSKKFATAVLIIIAFIAIFFAIRGAISFFKNKKGGANNGEPIQMTVGSIIQKDGNSNGIADWEEYLWGLDPFKDGPENKEFILAKKKSLEQKGIITNTDDSKTITQNELLSRQFFATIMSLQQTGQLDDTAIQSISEAVGQQISTTPIADVYASSMLNIKADSFDADLAYFTAYGNLLAKYKDADLGSELTLVSQGILNQDPQALYATQTVASAYRSFGRELIKIPVPSSVSTFHLALSNDYEKVANSIDGLTQVISDPIIGMRSILNYKKYVDALEADLNKISEILQ